ncbi:hypothetical protein [Sunxiuqinia dokdonensis]|uniref:Outer membrane protein beta-barrel domain-containing protein n=1 Tax=Sunxiuqinia dokdonensis TaxID=1409788 RepID=A0A0L8V6J5_9BACT|nr:hypothetical protein [Sunxiuqinia dokdonensis]KOH43812.1 hypothetical protein NC99_33080 [Sunxiuqinia dokdonensis]
MQKTSNILSMMKTARIASILVFVCFVGLTTANAQRDYRTGIGFRAGPMAGLTVRHFISQQEAVELSMSSRWSGSVFHGLYERHHNVMKDSRLNWFYGGGIHVGHWNLESNLHPWFSEDGSYTAFGIDGIAGLEYCLVDAPISFSLDWKPMFNVINKTRFRMDDVGLTIRVFFGNA